MKRIAWWYQLGFVVAGAALIISVPFLVFRTTIGVETLLFLALAVPTGWVRMRFEPSAHLTLTPVLVFTAALSLQPLAAVFIAVFSAVLSATLFARRTWRETLVEVAIEGIPTLLLVAPLTLVLPLAPSHFGEKVLAFIPGFVAFVSARFLLTAAWSHVREGVSVKAFVAGPGRQILTNLPIFALEAVVLTFLATSYSRLGLLALALAVAALVEFYYPYKLLSDQEDAMYASLAMIAQAIDAKDPYTARHSRNVAQLAVRIARELGLDEADVRKIRVGALLHDIGKVGVSGNIIRKPVSLEEHEGIAMRQHPVISAEIMAPVEFLKEASDIVRHHHEHIDGSGYPDGLKGEEIPIGSRVILAADAFDAMTSDRTYRKGRSRDEALKVLAEHAERQFDRKVVMALDAVLRSV